MGLTEYKHPFILLNLQESFFLTAWKIMSITLNHNLNFTDLDDGGRWSIVDNTYNGKSWARFTNKHSENLYRYEQNLLAFSKLCNEYQTKVLNVNKFSKFQQFWKYHRILIHVLATSMNLIKYHFKKFWFLVN